jgi:valyl-tRNA synthetase
MRAMITTVRNVRAERGFTPKDRFRLFVKGNDARDANFFRAYAYLLIEMARLTEVVIDGEPPEGTHQDVVEGFTIAIEFPEKVVTPEQLERIQRDIEKTEAELAATNARLANDQFVSNAPRAVVQGAENRRAELLARLEKLKTNK